MQHNGRIVKARWLALGACLLVVASCSSAAGSAAPRVSVIGDSITSLSANDINQTLGAAHYQPTTIGRIGYTAAQVQGDVVTQSETHPSVVVFELGTNDVTMSDTAEGYAEAYERTMTAYKAKFSHSCIVVTTVSSHRPSPTMDDTATTINTWLLHNFSHVIDWDQHEWNAREKGEVLVDADEVHPNPAGQAALAHLVLEGVQSCSHNAA
jgi:lysophospholipase L1-like esterase